MSKTSPDWSAELHEALWEIGREFGVDLEVSQQVAIARVVSKRPMEAATPEDVREAFAAVNLPRPPRAYAKAVLASIKGVASRNRLIDVLLDYRQFAIRSLSGQFGGRTQGEEEALRNNLLTYLPKRGYTEARTGRGRTDILLPKPDDAIVEVKVWKDMNTYRDGVEELRRYIHTEQPAEACIVVFGDRDPLPSLITDHRQATAPSHELEGLTVPVVVVPFEVDAPSKAASSQRRRERGKR